MKYIATPVVVEAFKIIKVGNAIPDVGYPLVLENGDDVIATTEMVARMRPAHGDYWVIQEDGYVYINPKQVFERKYRIHERTER